MEKNIKIDLNNNGTTKNHTKKKDDLQKKAEINAIMEKYNLKVPKKSKILDNKVDFTIKPKAGLQLLEKAVPKTGLQLLEKAVPKAELQLLEKAVPKTGLQLLEKAVPKTGLQLLEKAVPKAELQLLEKAVPKAELQKSRAQTEALNITNEPVKILKEPVNTIYPKNISLQKEVNLSQTKGGSSLEPSVPSLEVLKPSIQKIINNDKKIIEQKKMEMPKAIISKNIHPKDFLSSSNIYNIIPTVKPTVKPTQYNTHLQTIPIQNTHLQTKPIHIPNHIPVPNTKSPTKNISVLEHNINNDINNNINNSKPIIQHGSGYVNTFKKITINPKLSLDDSQTYKGEVNEVRTSNSNPNSNLNSNLNNLNNPKMHIEKKIISPKIESTPQIKTISTSRHKNFIQNENTSTMVNDLEMRRKVLQEQQQKELAKLKYKKEQILKIHNRKKEIELMKSIEIEKQKLRMIQNKQNELNNIINNQNSHQNGGNVPSHSQSQTQKNIIYNVDAKKTKKREFENFTNNIIVKDVDNFKNNKVVMQDLEITSHKIIKKDIDNFKSNKGGSSREPLVPSLEPLVPSLDKIEKDVKKKEKTKESNEKYNYYSKKDKPEIKWPTKTELYDTINFTENITIALDIQPVFGNKKLLKDKTTLDERKIILQNTYNFKNINKFNNNIIHSIYKILEYDKIILIN